MIHSTMLSSRDERSQSFPSAALMLGPKLPLRGGTPTQGLQLPDDVITVFEALPTESAKDKQAVT